MVSKATKMEPNGAKKEPKWSQKIPKGPKMEPKGAKRDQKGAQGCQKGAKRRPKCIQKSMSEKGRQKYDSRDTFWSHFGLFLVQKPLKMRSKNHLKNDTEKVMKKHEKSIKKGAKIDEKSMRFRNLRILVFCRESQLKIRFS